MEKKKDHSESKPAVLRLKIDLVSDPTFGGGVGKYAYVYAYLCVYVCVCARALSW